MKLTVFLMGKTGHEVIQVADAEEARLPITLVFGQFLKATNRGHAQAATDSKNQLHLYSKHLARYNVVRSMARF